MSIVIHFLIYAFQRERLEIYKTAYQQGKFDKWADENGTVELNPPQK